MPESLAAYIDHTLLKPDASEEEIKALCKEALKYGFYSVCINSSYVQTANKELEGSGVKVCSVIGFPLGASTTAAKAFEAGEAVKNGADEVDMVIHIGALISNDRDYVIKDIADVVQAAARAPVKVIIEAALLDDERKRLACELACEGGAAFVKTSTGFGHGGATVADVKLMRETVGPDIGVKASGGVRTAEAARQMIEAGATRIGTSSGPAIIGS